MLGLSYLVILILSNHVCTLRLLTSVSRVTYQSIDQVVPKSPNASDNFHVWVFDTISDSDGWWILAVSVTSYPFFFRLFFLFCDTRLSFFCIASVISTASVLTS